MDGYVDVGSPVPSDVGKRPHPPLVIGTRLHPLLHLLYIQQQAIDYVNVYMVYNIYEQTILKYGVHLIGTKTLLHENQSLAQKFANEINANYGTWSGFNSFKIGHIVIYTFFFEHVEYGSWQWQS